MSNRDLGMGSGKGSRDRTSDLEKFNENLDAIPRNPADKSDFVKVGTGRFRKCYGKPVAPAPLTGDLLTASRVARGAIGGCSSEN